MRCFRFVLEDGRELVGPVLGAGGFVTEQARLERAARLAAKGRPTGLHEPRPGHVAVFPEYSADGNGEPVAVALSALAAPAELRVGDEAWCFLTKKSGANARWLVGGARVRVVALPSTEGGPFLVEVRRATEAFQVGQRLEVRRFELYACRDRAEHATFGAEVDRLWGPAYRGQAGR